MLTYRRGALREQLALTLTKADPSLASNCFENLLKFLNGFPLKKRRKSRCGEKKAKKGEKRRKMASGESKVDLLWFMVFVKMGEKTSSRK